MRSVLAISMVLFTAATVWGAPANILVKPFQEADSQQPDWINRAITQSVVDELSSMKDVTVSSSAENQPAAPASASASTTQPSGNPDYTVSGNIQRVNQQLRVSGTVTNSAGKNVGGFKATGSTQDLFAIEDSLADQLRDALGLTEQAAPPAQPTASTAAGTGGAAPAGAPANALAGSDYTGSDLQRAAQNPGLIRQLSDRSYYNSTASTPAGVVAPTTTYPPNYGYPPYYYGAGWGWGWGWGFPNVVIINPGNNKNRDHDHHHDHDRDHNRDGHSPGWDNGQAIRSRAVGAGGNISSPPQLVPSGSPQLVPSGSPQHVPSGGPQLVPGNPVPRGMGGGGSAPKGAGVNTNSHAPGAGYNSGPVNAPGAGYNPGR
jgi:TolB-like protein